MDRPEAAFFCVNTTTPVAVQAGEPLRLWWEDFPGERIAPHDYPLARVRAAQASLHEKGRRLERAVEAIKLRSRTADEVVRGITRFVQAALVHPPLLQPSTARWGYWRWRRAGLLPAVIAGHEEVRALLHQRLVMDPEVLLALGEGRCGQCAAVLCAGLKLAGFQARPWQLPHHVAVEVELDGEVRVIDADAFKNGVFLEEKGSLVPKRTLVENPYWVDRFKPTGWMFRRDSVYARRSETGRPYCGYVDFYSPEDDGQISARYGAPIVLRPPGLPRWTGVVEPLRVSRGVAFDLAFSCRFADRAAGYRVRCGRRSRGYGYDRLMLPALHQETSADGFEIELRDPCLSPTLTEPGRYYLTAAAIPSYLEEFPSYVWWSDELIVDVV